MKKILLTLGAITSAVAPLAAVVSCGDKQASATEAKKQDIKVSTSQSTVWDGVTEGRDYVTGGFTEEYTRTTPVKIATNEQTPSEYMKHYINGVEVNVRIPDWEHMVDFDQAEYDKHSDQYIKTWEIQINSFGNDGPPDYSYVPQMVPFNTVHHFEAAYKDETLGELLDEINAKTHIEYFKWNMEREKAGPDGRFLYGILKGNVNPTEDQHNMYYGIYEKNSFGTYWGKYSDDYYSYISLSSPTNPLSSSVDHNTFMNDESSQAYDNRLPKGCDNIHLKNHDIINLNFWRMVNY